MNSFMFKIDKKKLYLVCADKCLSVSETVKKAGCSTMTYHRINNEKPLQSVTVGKIAKFLCVDAKELVED